MMTAPLEQDAGALARIASHHDTTSRAGDCQHPVLLTGTRLVVEADTGRVLRRLDSATADGQTITLRCRNRRTAVCPACSTVYRLDAYHLISAGLSGGKNIPTTITTHPRLFATFTAPSFGKVHIGPAGTGAPRPCHPGMCGRWHSAGDRLIGAAIDPDGYDYSGQVLFNAHAGALWADLATGVRRALAAAAGLTRKEAAAQVRVVFAKVTEFQARGVVHFHAIVRLDHADGPASPPPDWASVSLLRRAIRRAARHAAVTTTPAKSIPARRLRFGRQLDIKVISHADPSLSDTAVARYVAKYATKAAETAGLDLPPICCRTCTGRGVTGGMLCRTCGGTGRRPGVDLDGLSEHARRMVETCWRLGRHPELAGLRLRRHAHQAGYRGHFCTKSRAYSTTLAALRAERQAYTDAQTVARLDHPGPLVIVSDWRYQGRATDLGSPGAG